MNFDIKDPFEFQVVPEEIIRKLSRGESLDGICNEMFNYLARSIPGFFNMRPFVFVGPVRGYQVFMVQAYFAVLWREATNEQKAHYIRELTTRFLPIWVVRDSQNVNIQKRIGQLDTVQWMMIDTLRRNAVQSSYRFVCWL